MQEEKLRSDGSLAQQVAQNPQKSHLWCVAMQPLREYLSSFHAWPNCVLIRATASTGVRAALCAHAVTAAEIVKSRHGR